MLYSTFLTSLLTATASPASSEEPKNIEEQISLVSQAVNKMVDSIKQWINDYALAVLFTILIALAVYFIGKKIIKVILKITKRTLDRSNVEDGAAGFICTIVNAASYLVLIIIVAGILGLNTNSLVTLLGTAGLSVGLALKGTMSNFAGGLLILVTKPFVVGDYIVAGANEGTVTKIDIIYTYINTPDNQSIVLPNGDLSSMELKNTTNEEKRRLDIMIPVAYATDMDQAREVLTKTCRANELVLSEEPVEVLLYEFGDSAINVMVRVWTETDNYWTLKWRLQEEVKKALDQAQIEIPFNQLDVNIVRQIETMIEKK